MRALSVREKELGSEHKLVAASLTKLAQLYHFLDKTNAADFHFKRALKIYQRSLGSRHPGTLRILELYASFLESTGKSGKAKEYRTRAKEIRAANKS